MEDSNISSEDGCSRQSYALEISFTNSNLPSKHHHSFKCDSCNKSFDKEDDLRLHVGFEHNYKRFLMCHLCKIAFKHSVHLRYHYASAHGHVENPFLCAHCNSSFKRRFDLQKHITQVHVELRPFLCYTCGLTFKSNYNLERHIGERHNNFKAFKCPQCKQNFKRRPMLLKHNCRIESSNSNTADQFICSHCSSSFDDKSELIHHIQEGHICFRCDQIFDKIGQVKVHNCVKRPNFKCSKCELSFKKNSDLTRHVREVHRKCKGFVCPICSRTFTRKYGLQRHNNEFHSNTKPTQFQCLSCSSAFKRYDYLQRHMRTRHSKAELPM